MDTPTPVFTVEGAGTSYVHPVGLAMLLICGMLLMFLPRKYALFPFAVMICFVSARQCIAFAGFNLYFARFMILVFGTARLIIRRDAASIKFNSLDCLVVAYGVLYFVCGALNWGFAPNDMKTRSGYVVEGVGTYLLCRVLIQSVDEAKEVIRQIAIIACVTAVLFGIEHLTRRNLFAIFGGVPDITAEREGRLRCQGAFGHPIIAGVFWAVMLPLLIGGCLDRWRGRWIYGLGALASLSIIVLSASSTPILGAAVAIAGWAMFRFRAHSRRAFWAFVALLVVLHLVMNAPVWSLIQRINITSGNSGYHRYILVDGLITHFHEWWFLGSRVGTAHWGHYTFDTSNHYVAAAVGGGSSTLLVLVLIIAQSITAAGRVSKSLPRLGWGIGVSSAVNAVCFLGIAIWGQMHFAWALPIALASSLRSAQCDFAPSVSSMSSAIRGPRIAVRTACA